MPESFPEKPVDRARLAALDALARTSFRRDYVLKGGSALECAYGSPRASEDLDLSAVRPWSRLVTEEKNQRLKAFCDELDAAMARVAKRYGFGRMAFHEVKTSEEIPAALTRIGYGRATDPAASFDGLLELQVTLSEVVCETEEATYRHVPLHVPSLADIVAEKLKSLLQQATRDTVRSTDVYDLWYYTAHRNGLVDPEKAARFLKQKSEPWPDLLPVSRAKFYDPIVREHAARDYEALQAEIRSSAAFPPFDEAFEGVLRFVDRLDLPER